MIVLLGSFYIVLTFFRWTLVLRCCKLKFERLLVKFGYMKRQQPNTHTALLSLPLIIENPLDSLHVEERPRQSLRSPLTASLAAKDSLDNQFLIFAFLG